MGGPKNKAINEAPFYYLVFSVICGFNGYAVTDWMAATTKKRKEWQQREYFVRCNNGNNSFPKRSRPHHGINK
jgi:hypothetical protein